MGAAAGGDRRLAPRDARGGSCARTQHGAFALIELRGAGRLAFGDFFEGGATLALLKAADSSEASGWLADTGFWKNETLRARPLLYAL